MRPGKFNERDKPDEYGKSDQSEIACNAPTQVWMTPAGWTRYALSERNRRI